MRKPAPNRGAGEGGFTLFEMLVALAVLALVVVTVASLGPRRSSSLAFEAAARNLVNELKAVRIEAIAGNRDAVLIVDVDAKSYWPEGTGRRTLLPPEVGLETTTGDGDVLAGNRARFRFAPDGSGSGGHIVLKADGRRADIGVDWLTGRITLVEAR